MSKQAVELRNISNKLVAKYYRDIGVLEIVQKGDYLRIILPPDTVIRCETGRIAH